MKTRRILFRVILCLFVPFYLNIIFYLIKAYFSFGYLPDLHSTEVSGLGIGFSVLFNVFFFYLLEFSFFGGFIVILISSFTKLISLTVEDFLIFLINVVLHILFINLGLFDIFTWVMG